MLLDKGVSIMKKHKRYFNAYYTVEASFIMPTVIVLILFMIIYLFYLYNCTVCFQACYIAALRGSQMQDASADDIKTKVEEYAGDLLNKQVYEYQDIAEVKAGLLSIEVKTESGINNIFNVTDLLKDRDMKISTSAKAGRVDPVDLIRMKY